MGAQHSKAQVPAQEIANSNDCDNRLPQPSDRRPLHHILAPSLLSRTTPSHAPRASPYFLTSLSPHRMTINNIYIARHGYRMNWLPPPHPPNPTGIDSDPPLAPHGVEQAKELAKYITSLDEKPQFILTSPFYRCVETAEPVSEALDIPIVLERGVGEWYKVGRGVIPEPANYDTLTKFFKQLSTPEIWHRDNTIGVIPSLNGETEEQIFARCKEFWQKFIPIFELKYPEISSILIVSHAATKIALGMSLMGYNHVKDLLEDGLKLRAGACSLDKYVKSGDNWDLKMNGNCDFLTQGEEMNWDFHYGFEAGSDEDIKARQAAAAGKSTDDVVPVVPEKTEPESSDPTEPTEVRR